MTQCFFLFFLLSSFRFLFFFFYSTKTPSLAPVDGSEWTEDEAKLCLFLHFALCTQNPDLLTPLVQVFLVDVVFIK